MNCFEVSLQDKDLNKMKTRIKGVELIIRDIVTSLALECPLIAQRGTL